MLKKASGIVLMIAGLFFFASSLKMIFVDIPKAKSVLKEAVYVGNHTFAAYPVVHMLRKKHIPVLTMVEKDGRNLLVRIPSGS